MATQALSGYPTLASKAGDPAVKYVNGVQYVKQYVDGQYKYIPIKLVQTQAPQTLTQQTGGIPTFKTYEEARNYSKTQQGEQRIEQTGTNVFIVRPNEQPTPTSTYVTDQPPTQQQKAPPKADYASAGGDTGGGSYDEWGEIAKSLGGRMPSGQDINPKTGKAYAVNPASGAWDDNYFQNTVIPSIKNAYASNPELDLYGQNRVSQISYDEYVKKAEAELNKYYEEKLKEANWDADLAITRMEEDYVMGKRQRVEDASRELSDLMQVTMPGEMRSLLGNLNQRGLLTTPGGVQAATQTTLPSGERITPTRVTGQTYGGLAGSRLAELTKSQQSRQQAIERALQRAEQEQELGRTRKVEDVQTTRKRLIGSLQEEKSQKIPELAYSRWSRASSLAQLGQQEALSGKV